MELSNHTLWDVIKTSETVDDGKIYILYRDTMPIMHQINVQTTNISGCMVGYVVSCVRNRLDNDSAVIHNFFEEKIHEA